ncbi:MAG: carbohydrate kinase family protein [Candidatus Beckwithbacteria bacterium]
MKFEVVTFGSSFVDVYLSSKEFKMVRTGSSPTGVAMCEVYGGKIGVDKLVITTGGGATNTAVGFERLGMQTGCVTCVGKDHWGLFIRQELRKEGVSPLYIQQVNEPTSYSTILVGEDGGRSALIYRGASSKLSWHKVDWEKLEADWYYISSLGGDLNLLTKIVRTAKEKKIKVAFNPGTSEISAQEKLKAFLPEVEVLIVNRQEAARITKHEFKNKEEILTDLRKLGPRLVTVTEGRKGATLMEGRKIISLPAIKREVVEETGAGDAFGCGLVAGLIRYSSLEKALKLGLCNGASVVEHFGPKQGLLFSPEVEIWMKI